MELGAIFQYATVASATGLSALGVGIGQALITLGTIKSIYLQPAAKQEINKNSIIALAMTETGGIITLVLMLLMLFGASSDATVYAGISRLGMLFGIGLVSLAVGIVSAIPAREACNSIARQPFASVNIGNMMLVTMSIIQTPVIFGFIVGLIIHLSADGTENMPQALALLAAGICIGVGSIGPIIGQGRFAGEACKSIGLYRDSYRNILTFSLLSQAIIESPIVFALLVSLILLTLSVGDSSLKACAFLAAAFCAGFTNIGVGLSSGMTATSACKQIAQYPDRSAFFSRTSLLAQGLIDTFAIYGLLIALMLILFT